MVLSMPWALDTQPTGKWAGATGRYACSILQTHLCTMPLNKAFRVRVSIVAGSGIRRNPARITPTNLISVHSPSLVEGILSTRTGDQEGTEGLDRVFHSRSGFIQGHWL